MNELRKPQLNRQETGREQEFEAARGRLVRTLGEVVSFASISDGKHNEQIRGLFDYVSEYTRGVTEETGRGFYTREWDDGKGHISTIITPKSSEKSEDDLLLRPEIALLIHADVVDTEGHPEMFTMTQDEENLYGRGVYDMKQGLAIGLDLLSEMLEGAALIITSDEEVGGEHGAQFLAQTVGVNPNFLIVLDGQKSEHVSLGAKGAWHYKVTFGSLLHNGGHGSRYEDYSANELAMDIREELRNIYPWRYSNSPAGTTFNVGVMEGGKATNKVSENAFLQIDMRFPSDQDRAVGQENLHIAIQDVVLQRLHEVYGDSLPVVLDIRLQDEKGASIYEVDVVNTENGQRYQVAKVEDLAVVPVYNIDKGDRRVQRFAEILEETTGVKTQVNDKDTGAHDGSNWPNVAAIVYMPKGGGAHKNNEWVNAGSVVETREAIAKFLHEELS